MYNINGLLQLTLQENNAKYLNTLPFYLFNEIEETYIKFIYDYLKKYSQLPTREVFENKFPSFRTANLDNIPLQYYYDQLKPLLLKEYVAKRIKEQKEKGFSEYESDFIHEISEKIKLPNPDYVNYSEFDRDEYFKDVVRMSWGVKFLNEWFGSLNGTDLIGIFGRLKSNKTTFLQVIGYILFYLEKRNLLVFSNENTPLQFAQVFDSFLGQFNNKKFRTLDENDLAEVKDKISVVKKKLNKHKGEIILAGSAKTPADIIAAIRNCKNKPDVILLDGLHAMSFSSKDTGTQSLSIAETMKQLRQITYDYNIPIIFVTQGNRSSAKTDEPSADSVALSDSIPQYVDGLMGCTIVEYNGNKYCKIYLTANRFGVQGVSKFMKVNADFFESRKIEFYDIQNEEEPINITTVNDDEYLDSLKDDE